MTKWKYERGAQRRRGTGAIGVFTAAALAGACIGCRSPVGAVRQADERASAEIAAARATLLGEREAFTVERPSDTLRRRLIEEFDLPISAPASKGSAFLTPPEHWPRGLATNTAPADAAANAAADAGTTAPSNTLQLTLVDALEVAAANNADYQQQKEQIFSAALALDLAREEFRTTFAGALSTLLSSDSSGDARQTGLRESGEASLTRKTEAGMAFTAKLGIDLVRLLTGEKVSARGLVADLSVTVPLLRGARTFIVREPLTQAERNVLYAICSFEEYKRTFALRVIRDYLSVLQSRDEVLNAEENLRMLNASAARVRRMAEAGRIPGIQVDQASQDLLRAHDRLIRARLSAQGALDAFKTSLGLPPDAPVALDRGELTRLMQDARDRGLIPAPGDTNTTHIVTADADTEVNADAAFTNVTAAVRTALANRRDVYVVRERVLDAQRAVIVAADQLQGEVSLSGTAHTGSSRSVGSAGLGDAELAFDQASYTGLLNIDLPLQRTEERVRLRNALIDLDQAVRTLQTQEDDVKLAVADRLRELAQARDGMTTQAQAVELAERRQRSTDLFLQAGRAEVRDLLEAQEALLSARNALTAAAISYRVAELGLQRDLGLLSMDESGHMMDMTGTERATDEH